VELSREQQRARQFDVEYGQLSLEQSTWGMPARVEKIARETLRMQLPASVARGDRRGWERSSMRAPARRHVAPPAELPRVARAAAVRQRGRAVRRAARPLALPAMDRERFPAGQGAARFSREIEVPAHRGRIVDRYGDALAISTPVKSLWVFRDRSRRRPSSCAALARVLETDAAAARSTSQGRRRVHVRCEQLAPQTAERALASGSRA
jgi:hypothetical protein